MNEALNSGVQIATIVTGLAVILSLVFTYKQLRDTSKVQNLQQLLYLHEYLSRGELSKARHLTRTVLCKKVYSDWSPTDKEAANEVCASYDQAGMLVQEHVLDKGMTRLFLKSSWGESVCDQLEILQPYLSDQQTPHKTGREFFVHFVALYDRARIYHRA